MFFLSFILLSRSKAFNRCLRVSVTLNIFLAHILWVSPSLSTGLESTWRSRAWNRPHFKARQYHNYSGHITKCLLPIPAVTLAAVTPPRLPSHSKKVLQESECRRQERKKKSGHINPKDFICKTAFKRKHTQQYVTLQCNACWDSWDHVKLSSALREEA